MPIAVIVPCLNEAGNIGPLVREIHEAADATVIVADNGSTDDTAREAEAAGAIVVSESRQGYGHACAAGVAAATGAEVLTFIDGDRSFLPQELPSLLTPILTGQADLVLGSRFRGHIAPGAMPLHQRVGNKLIAFLVNRIHGTSLTDLGPYRAVRADLLRDLGMKEMTYGWPVEMIVKAAKSGARVSEVPVSFHPREFGQSKVSGTVRGTVRAGAVLLRLGLRRGRT